MRSKAEVPGIEVRGLFEFWRGLSLVQREWILVLTMSGIATVMVVAAYLAVSDLNTRVSTIETQLSRIETRLSTIETEVSSFETQVVEIDATVNALESKVELLGTPFP